MKKTLLAIGTLCLVGSPVLAGPNANGSLILAWADGVVQCFDGGAGVEDYCGATGIQNCTDALVETTGADVARFDTRMLELNDLPVPGRLPEHVAYSPGVDVRVFGLKPVG